MRLFKKIKASALQFAILVATIVAILLGSFLTLTYTQHYFNTQSDFVLNTIDQANKGIEHSLLATTEINDSISSQTGLVETTLTKKYWGGFEKITATASVKTKSFTKTALIGSAIFDPPTALYLADDNLPLVLVGNTKIEGKAYIPNSGVKPGTISGNYFYGTELVKGPMTASSGSLPQLDPGWETYIEWMVSYVPSANDRVIPQPRKSQNSFLGPVEIIYDQSPIVLTENYRGNILIKSERDITVTANAKLKDVVLVAPTITIEKGFSGTIHCIAEERISLEEQVSLRYPSSIVVIGSVKEENKRTVPGEEPIYIAANAKMSGTVLYLGKEKKEDERSTVHIAIEPDAIIKGMIYCKGNTELSGTVMGSVYTEHFIANEAGSRYINHIYNGTILGNDVHPKFSGLPFSKTKKEIAQWLY